MTQGFQEWFKDYHSNNEAYAEIIANDAWNARQAEIDELQKKLKLGESLRDGQFEHLTQITEQRDLAQANNRELQKRIDEATDYADGVHSENWQETINTMLYILKGEQN